MLFKGGDGLWIEMLTLLLLLLCLALQVDPPLIGCRKAGMEASCEQVSETRAPMRHCGREGSYSTDAKKTAIITCMSACVCVCACACTCMWSESSASICAERHVHTRIVFVPLS